ncbi:efflux RND transporter periplasmic adaptor subunit [Luteimonas composti]|uniref:Efflux RND transporter periplasmic adaptor subunit n=1 Tax=Luteimonas composti TaxID=398257 RepID=A0ABT6MPN4_9GAMM|nr:efflux RND transporter periplasmic adaptor subunit [Luteimonas composti]MDH7452558.1 efflux RND transporter periplasmic adaptor subunit [Luteimonas composti]
MRTLHACLIATASVATLGVLLLRGDAGANPPAVVPAAPPATVSVAPAVSAEFAPRHWAPGAVASRHDSRVAGEMPGRVLRVADVGTRLRKGEPIAMLDDTALQLEERERAAEMARIRVQLDLAQAQERRYAALSEQRGIARAQYEQQRAERDTLVQELARTGAQLAQVRHQRAQMVVRAPFDGIVAERMVEAGEYLLPGGAVARLVDPGAQEVHARAPVALAKLASPGSHVRVRSEGEERSGRITALVPIGDDASRQLEVRVALDDTALPVGTPVTVGLPSAVPRTVVAVPRDALVLRSEGDYVVRIDAGERATRLPVRAGAELDDLVEVEGNVRPGDRLVVRGGERVEPGQSVRIEPMRAVAMR